jgi:hypothetical protein
MKSIGIDDSPKQLHNDNFWNKNGNNTISLKSINNLLIYHPSVTPTDG